MKHLTRICYSRSSSVLNIFYLSLLAVLFLNSCTSLRIIGIEVAVQPEYPIAEDIQSLALLNRSMTKQFADNKADTLEKILIKNSMKMDTVFQDSIATDTLIQVAARTLFESGRFDVVVPKERNIVRTDIKDIANPVNPNFIKEICHDFEVDAVLILESFDEQIIARQSNKKNYWNKEKTLVYEPTDCEAVTKIFYYSEWRLYRATEIKPLTRFVVGDTIFWKANGSSFKDLQSQMPKIKAALIGGGIAAAFKMCGYISPEWINLNRYYFITGNNQIDAAIPLIKKNKWQEAAVIWNKYAAIPSKSIRSKVEFNLALASEMNGDLDMAMQWCGKSIKTNYSLDKKVYLSALAQRLKEKEKEDAKRKI
ncbi:MAG: DUF6340 family protein [Bacteroidia bacterium]|nr:DUF6340 family protein [Bacteroidia bacterium]